MIRSLVVFSSAVLASVGAMSGAIIGHTFTGKTYFNPATELDGNFPIGTPWEVRVEWDDAAVGEVYTENQAGYPLTKMTLTLKGKNGDWTSSSLPGKASMSLGRFGAHEIQFTGGWGPESYTNGKIPGGATYSINIVLSDPTNTALPDITTVPGPIDLSKWTPETRYSHLKFYITEMGAAIYGNVDGLGATSEPPAPEIVVQHPKGVGLRDGKSAVTFDSVTKGRTGQTKTFVIKNTGKATLKALDLVIGGLNRKDFVTEGLPKRSLAPGTQMSFKVTFKPTAVGARKAVVKIGSNDANENPFTVVVRGTGL